MGGLAYVILHQKIVDRLAVFLDLDDVLALLGEMQRAFAADHFAGDGDLLVRAADREGPRDADRQQQADGKDWN
jgi:hypothetical protein